MANKNILQLFTSHTQMIKDSTKNKSI